MAIIAIIILASVLGIMFYALHKSEEEWWDEWVRGFTCGRYKTRKEFIARK